MKKSKKVTLICIILSVFFLSSCVAHKADTNGLDDYSLTEITTEDILSPYGSNVTTGSLRVQNGNKCTVKIKKLSGVNELFSLPIGNSDLHLTIDAEVTAGNCRVVLCAIDQILEEIPINEGEQEITVHNLNDKVFLKVAGESAQLKITYEYNVEESESYII